MSAPRLIRYPFGGTSTVPFDAYGRSLLRHRRHLLRGFPPFLVFLCPVRHRQKLLTNSGFRWVQPSGSSHPCPGWEARLREPQPRIPAAFFCFPQAMAKNRNGTGSLQLREYPEEFVRPSCASVEFFVMLAR